MRNSDSTEQNKKTRNFKEDIDSRVFDAVVLILLLTFTALILIPLWNILIASFTTGTTLTDGGFVLLPSSFSLDNYRVVFTDTTIYRAALVSVARTVIGSLSSVFFCAMVAYGMSKKNLFGRKVYSAMGITTMFFSGGLIPLFLLIRSLGLLDSFWVYIIPGLFGYWNVILLMNFFRGLPPSLEEAALIDGAGYWRIFLTIVLPLSKACLAALILFSAVSHWNDFMTARIYVTNRDLHPLAMRLFEIVSMATMQDRPDVPVQMQVATRGIQLATIVITTAPIVMVYPFLQKYFVSGLTLGAVKE